MLSNSVTINCESDSSAGLEKNCEIDWDTLLKLNNITQSTQ